MMDANQSTVLVALIVSVIAPTIVALATNWSRRKELAATWAREDEVAAKAREVAYRLAANTKENFSRLDKLQTIATGTHVIVNNQRTVLLKLNADLRERIARENPDDKEAQSAAKAARAEANKAASAQSSQEAKGLTEAVG